MMITNPITTAVALPPYGVAARAGGGGAGGRDAVGAFDRGLRFLGLVAVVGDLVGEDLAGLRVLADLGVELLRDLVGVDRAGDDRRLGDVGLGRAVLEVRDRLVGIDLGLGLPGFATAAGRPRLALGGAPLTLLGPLAVARHRASGSPGAGCGSGTTGSTCAG